MKLYDYVLSGNCYKIRLLASLLNLKFEMVPVDFYPGREHRSPAFRELNPLGQIPALEDDGIFCATRKPFWSTSPTATMPASNGGRPTIR